MQTITIAIVISVVVAGTAGAGAMAVSIAYSTKSTRPPIADPAPPVVPYQHIPTTGSKGW